MKKIVVGFIIYFCFSSIAHAANFGEMATSTSTAVDLGCTKATSPATVMQSAPGNIVWINPNNIAAEDGIEASLDSHSAKDLKDVSARLILADGTIGLVDKSNTDKWTVVSHNVSYGSDIWGVNLTSKDINDPHFGFAFQIGSGITNSYVLKATNFGFHIPSPSTVTGVIVEVKRREAMSSGQMIGYVDQIRMSICYKPSIVATVDRLPIILAKVGSLENIRVAPGEFLSIPMTLQVMTTMPISDAAMVYQIRSNNRILIKEIDDIKTLKAVKTIQIPNTVAPGIYEATATFLYEEKPVANMLNFHFTVENKIAGVFVSQLMYSGVMLFLFCMVVTIAIYLFSFRRKKASTDYSNISEPDREYYEIISDMLTQMHDSIGDKAYKMVEGIAGLTVDKTNGRIVTISKDPSEVASVLYIKYQNVFKKKLKIATRSHNKKTTDNALTIENNLGKFEKYFSKK